MIVGDARVSTTEQNFGLQHDDLRRALDDSVDPTNAHYGQVLNEKQPTANQCDGLFFFQVGTIA